ncbi:MAG: response regulator [Nannocystaceae bacterium]|nr:response regulator [Nannocystaceae bacterium]
MSTATTHRTSHAPEAGAARILVADDTDSDRRAARDALEAAGHAVIEATDGQHALEVFARERPDLVMLDVVMPRLSGLECCRILKAKTQQGYLPVIMVSTRNSVNARVEGLRSGADDYLGKPYDAEELRARVDALLRARRVLGDSEPRGDTPGQGDGRLDATHLRRLEQEFDRAERYSDPLACLRIAPDAEEPSASMAAGLRTVIDATVRKIDLVFPARAGGYLVALPNTHFPGALAVAERIWRDVRARGDGSVSIGVAFFPNRDVHALRELIELCDAALERARGEGGGRICLFQHQGYMYAPEES